MPPKDVGYTLVNTDGVIPKKWRDIALETTNNGNERINRINYETYVLQALRKPLRTKQVWVVGVDRYRNPEQDLPDDLAQKRDSFYEMLQASQDAQVFIDRVQASMQKWLATLNNGLPSNPKVKLRQQGKNRIHLSPLSRRSEPLNTMALKREIGKCWSDIGLIGLLIKEVDLRLG